MLIAVVYMIVVPKVALLPRVGAGRRSILKYGHSLVWLLLAFSCVLAHYGIGAAQFTALGAVGVYVVFVIILLVVTLPPKSR